MRVIARVHKSISADGKYYDWYNQHVFDVPFTFNDVELCFAFIENVARYESAFHGTGVAFHTATMGLYGDLAHVGHDVSEVVSPVASLGIGGTRNVGTPAPWYYALMVYKFSGVRRPSKNFYFGALGADDYHEGKDGVPVLTNWNWFTNAEFDAWNAYIAPSGAKFLQVHRPDNQQQAEGFSVARVEIGHVVKCHAIRKKNAARDSRLTDLRNMILVVAHQSVISYRILRQYQTENGDFVPTDAIGHIQNIIMGIEPIFEQVKGLLMEGKPPKDGRNIRPVFRFGATNEQIYE